MAHWEIDVEIRVRKTLCFSGPQTAAAAEDVVRKMLVGGGIDIRSLQKWEMPAGRYPPLAVETAIDNDPDIVAVRHIDGED